MTAVAAERRRSPRPPVLGKTTPRIWTPPLRRLTPKTSRGFACIEFAESLGIVLFPWQKWVLIHALELNPDGTYRFRVVIVLVARQNGKTTLLKVLSLWRMLEDGARTVVGTSTNMEYAREAWAATVELAEQRDLTLARERASEALDGVDVPDDETELLAYLPKRDRWCQSVKRGALDTSLTLPGRARYKVASASRTGGRSLSVDLGIADELREHRLAGELTGWEAWAALDGATTARPNSQVYGLSNAGDKGSVVLNHFRAVGIAFIETGEGDDTLGLFEWSGEDDCDLLDRRQWAQSNPSLGYPGGPTEATLASKSRLPAAVFRTEHLCQGVPTLKVAIDASAWRAGADPQGTLDGLRARVAVCVQVSEDLEHVTLIAAAQTDDARVRLEAVAAWPSVEAMRTTTPNQPSVFDLIRRIRPRLVGWFPTGPGAVLDVEFTRKYPKDRGRPRGCRLIGSDQSAACQGLAEYVKAGRVLHPNDPLINAQVIGATKQHTGDGWRFARRDAGHVDAADATAGAVHLARQVPRLRSPRVVTASA